MKTHQHSSPSSFGRYISQLHFRLLKSWALYTWLGVWMISSQTIQAQPVETLWQEGIRLEKRNEDVPALDYFMKILQNNPAHLGALCKASKLYSRLAGRSGIKSEKKEMMMKAKTLACEAIRTDKKAEIINTAWDLAKAAFSHSYSHLAGTSAKDAAVIAGIAVDKAQLLSGGATERVDVRTIINSLPESARSAVIALLAEPATGE